MVKLHTPTKVVTNGEVKPVMPVHSLHVLKDAPNFSKDETLSCFIARYKDGRFAVWDSTWKQTNKYHVFNSEQELHEHFEEL